MYRGLCCCRSAPLNRVENVVVREGDAREHDSDAAATSVLIVPVTYLNGASRLTDSATSGVSCNKLTVTWYDPHHEATRSGFVGVCRPA